MLRGNRVLSFRSSVLKFPKASHRPAIHPGSKWRKRQEWQLRQKLAGDNERGIQHRCKWSHKRGWNREKSLATTGRSLVRSYSPETESLWKTCLKEKGPDKLRSNWEDKVHIVLQRKHPESPVFDVKRENGQGGKRVLHRSRLLPCDHFPLEKTEVTYVQTNQTAK